MTMTPRTETIPYYAATLTRLAAPLETPEATYRAAEALSKTTFPREPGTDALQRLYGMGHQEALNVATSVSPYIDGDRPGRDPLEGEE